MKPAFCFLARILALFLAAAAVPARAQDASASVLASFNPADQFYYPAAGLTLAADGNFYGVSVYPRSDGGPTGSIYRMTPDGTLTSVYEFSPLDDNGVNLEGAYPEYEMVAAPDGNLYGVTENGGSGAAGTVFRYTPGGGVEPIYAVPGPVNPASLSPLLLGSDGNLYCESSAFTGFISDGQYTSYGTILQISLSGGATVLHSFVAGDGAYPAGGLCEGSDGSLYGTCARGPTDQTEGYGTVFKLAPGGGALTVLHAFTDEADGAEPFYGLTAVGQDVFYGTTQAGIYSVDADGDFKVRYEGTGVNAQLVRGRDGNYYAATPFSSINVSSQVFRVSADGTAVTTLLTFPYPPANPIDPVATAGRLLEGADGVFYGVTTVGGAFDGGTVYRAMLYSPPKPVVTITAKKTSIDEHGKGKTVVIVKRMGAPLKAPLLVHLTHGGSAVNGTDYRKLSGNVTIPAGAALVKLEVTAKDVGRTSGKRTVVINLKKPADGSYTIGDPMKVTLTILDDD